MFRDEYRKANDSIHVPDHLLESIKREAERSLVSDSRPRAKWSSILIYTGCATAVAALALLVFRPFSFRASGSQTAETTAYGAVNDESTEQMQLFSTESRIESAELSAPAAGASADSNEGELEEAVSAAFDRVDRTDGDEDEYIFFNNEPETTYDTVFEMLKAASTEEKPARKNRIIESASKDVRIEENILYAFGSSYELPADREIRALIEVWNNVYVISEQDGFVVTSAFTEAGFAGEVKQSGLYVAYEAKETTVFDDDYTIKEHRVILVTSHYSPDLSKVSVNEPESFVPVFSDTSGMRPLAPDEITCVNESASYTVYGAVEVTDKTTMLYIFAELG